MCYFALLSDLFYLLQNYKTPTELYIIQIMNVYECNGADILWVEICSVQQSEAKLNRTFHRNKNICTIALIKYIYYLFYKTSNLYFLLTTLNPYILDIHIHFRFHHGSKVTAKTIQWWESLLNGNIQCLTSYVYNGWIFNIMRPSMF